MKNTDRNNPNYWYRLDESNKLEDQVRWYIASTAEGYMNGGMDDGYEPMTKEAWKDYIKKSLDMDIENDMMVNGIEFKHMRFAGNNKLFALIDKYLDECKDVQRWVVR